MKSQKFYKFIITTFIVVLLLLFLTVFTDGWLTASSIPMSLVIYPAPSLFTLGVEPVVVFPRIDTAGATSLYEVEFPADIVIPVGGQIVLTYPFGFSFAASCSTSVSSNKNSDLNGPAPGVVTIYSITCDSTTRKVTLTTAGVATQAGDRIKFLLQDIVNSTVPKDFITSGYMVIIETKDASGSLLETKTSKPIFLVEPGSQSISGAIFNDNGQGFFGRANDGVQNGAEPGIADIKICLDGVMGLQCATTDTNGDYSFRQLTDGFYSVTIPPLSLINLIGGLFFRDINLVDGQNATGIDFAFRSSDRTITVNITKIPRGIDLDVFAFNPFDVATGGHVVREILWNGNTARSVSLTVSDGTWEVGVDPWISKDPSLGLPPVPDFSFISPRPQQIEVSGAGTYTVDFTLRRTNRIIKGKVIDSSGTAIPNVFLTARPAVFTSDIGGESLAQSLNDGIFELKVTNGVYMVDAFMIGMSSSGGREVTVQDDTDNGIIDNNSAADVYSNGILITNDGDSGNDNLVLKIAKGERSISGRVLDEFGNRIAYAHVSAEEVDDSGNPVGAWVDSPTDASGSFTLYVSDGTWKLHGFTPGYGELGSITVSVSGENLTGQDLQASSADFGTVEGQATKNGNAVSGAFVGIFGLDGANSTVTDGSGNYSLKVRAGSGYTIDGFLPGSGPLSVITNVTVAANTTIRDQNLTIETSGIIRVTISGISDAFVDAFDSDGRGNGTGSNPTPGVYDIFVPSGIYTVIAHNPNYGLLGEELNVVVIADDTINVSFTLPVANVVSGTIFSDSLICTNGASVFLSDADNGRVIIEITDSSGNYSVSMPDGTYLFGAGKPGCIDSAEPTTITVRGSDISSGTDRTLNLADTTVSGRVTLSDNNITVDTKVIAESVDRKFVFTDVDTTNTSGNNYTLNLTSGTWSVYARSDGYESGKNLVTVTSGDSQTLNLSLSAISGYTRLLRVSTSVKPSQGGIIRDVNIGIDFEVNIPAGALGSSSDSGSVSTKLTTSLVPETSTAKVVGGIGVEIIIKSASGQPITTLSTSGGSGIRVTIPYIESDVTALGGEESKLVLAQWSEEKQQWDPLATTVDTVHNKLTAMAAHFSIFAPILPVGGGAPAPPEPEPEPSPASSSGGSSAIIPAEVLVVPAPKEPELKVEFIPANLNGDTTLEGDDKIDIIDFSILLYNWGVPKNPKADLNSDGKVDIIDFSIMLYYWTG